MAAGDLNPLEVWEVDVGLCSLVVLKHQHASGIQIDGPEKRPRITGVDSLRRNRLFRGRRDEPPPRIVTLHSLPSPLHPPPSYNARVAMSYSRYNPPASRLSLSSAS